VEQKGYRGRNSGEGKELITLKDRAHVRTGGGRCTNGIQKKKNKGKEKIEESKIGKENNVGPYGRPIEATLRVNSPKKPSKAA